ncbi:MAG: undecaprenyldiphospho-muramoylpentapeptide beta-N-acetylglucosaminyltransferase [Acidimicrobiales bacterium]|nr:undecaprenyldiphospho-muramoylpentapeptide beta-N-acetylglucosaminyltransferase [Acidimicrobiales bacterium]
MKPLAAPGVMIAGGGTAGHVLPALAIAEALLDRGLVADRSCVHLVGSRRGIEVDLVPPTGFKFTVLPGRGVQRRITPVNLVSVFGLLVAFLRALGLLARHRPALVLSVGGYASVPCSLAATVLRVPLVVVEQNAVPGAANRLVGRFARACAVSFPGTALPCSTVTGNPVPNLIRRTAEAPDRSEIRARARAELGVEGRPFVVAFGGSLGARRINRAIVHTIEKWTDQPIVVEHVVGRRGWSEGGTSEKAANPASGVSYRAVEYEAEMVSVLSAADLVICRAGATSVAELTALGVPSILVPLPGAPDDHQMANARQLEAVGGARLVPDEELDGDRLSMEMTLLLKDPATLFKMSENARSLGRPDAADRVVDLVVEILDGLRQ